jgi:WD40 repeat protein
VVRLWDTESRTVVATLPHEAAVDYVAWSPDGTLATATVGGTVHLWGADGKERHRFTVAPLRPGSLAFTPDGGTVAVAAGRPLDTEGTGEQPGPEYTLHVWDARTGAERTVVDLGTAGTSAITFTRDGAHLLAATYDQTIVEASGTRTEAVLRRWRTDDLTELASVPMGDEQVTDLSVSPDNRTLAVVGTGRSVRLWRLDGSGGWRTFAEHPAQLREAAFSPDGATLATITRNDTVIRLWDVRTGTLSANLTGQTSLLNAVDFAPDGNTLATAAAGASVGLWTLDVRQVIDRLCRVLGDHPSC